MLNKAMKSAPRIAAGLESSDEILASIFHDTIPAAEADSVGNRRRLEDRLEAQRLKREMMEFDFDLEN